jgi:PAS domain S-box-containing protein
MNTQNKTKEELIKELQVLLQENNSLKKQNEKRTAELVIANKKLLFQNEEKKKRAEELSVANTELEYQSEEKEKRAEELIIANVELSFQKGEKGKRAGELITAKIELDFQNKEKRKRAAELIIANVELAFQKGEKGKRAEELIIANKELTFQKREKGKRATELIIANKELAFQKGEKGKRAEELILAKIKIVLQGEVNEKLASELIIANLALGLQEELIEAKEKAEESEKKFKLLYENAPLNYQSLDINACLIDVNPTWLQTLGYKREEVIGRPFSDFMTSESAKLIKERFPAFVDKGEIHNYEFEMIRKDGTRFLVSYDGKIGYDELGHFNKTHCIFTDITVRKKAEKEREQFFNFFKLSPDIMVIADPNGAFKAVNPTTTALLGYSEGELLSKPFIDFIHPDDKQSTLDEMASQIKIGSSLNFENRYKRKNGSYILLSWCSYFNKKEGITYATARDVTIERMIEIELLKAKEKAEESEKKFRNLFENSPIAKSITEIDGSLLVNKSFCDILGYSKKELETKKWEEITFPEEIEKTDEIVQSLLKGTNIQERFEKRYVHKNGNIIYAEVSTFLQRDNNNNPQYFITSFNDVTLRKKAEKEREQFFNFFKLSPDIMVIADPFGAFKAVNPATTELLGYSEEVLLSKPYIDFVHPDDIQITQEEAGQNIHGYTLNFENRYKSKDGSYILLSWSSYFSKEEGITYATARDVTSERMIEIELLNAKEKAERNEKELKKAQQIAHVGSWYMDIKTNEVVWTEELYKMYGFDPLFTVPSYTEHQKLFTAESWEILSKSVTNIRETGIPYEHELKIVKEDGSKGWVWVRGETVLDKENKIIGLWGAAQDITEKKQSEIELIEAKEHAEESDRLKSAFLANMSHEIRTPMNGILGFSDLLKTPNLSGEVQQQYIQIIEKSGMRMLNIINDIISISKIESGVMEVNLKASNINEQIEYIDTLFKPEAEAKGITLSFNKSLSLKEANVKTDHEKLNAILASLVKNAIKYTLSGSIEFGYMLKKDTEPVEVEFYVKDTGIGIDKDRQEAIFERFIQADILDKDAFHGAGLGLSISKAYVELLGGKIWVESEIGRGSIFYFTLPYDVETKVDVESIIDYPDRELETSLKKLKILIVDDDEKSSWLLGLMLKKLDKQVLYAENGLEAVEVCRNNPDIDLILMDIQMPVMNGYEATRQIREFNNEVVIITQTAFALSGDREKSLAAGCNDYISKPIGKALLTKLIKSYFN